MKKIIFLILILLVSVFNIKAFVPDEKTGSISITKNDSEKINRKEATLEDSKYGLYNTNNELITTMTIDINGKSYIDNIPYGMYYLKEIVSSKGYKLNLGSHTIIMNDSVPNWYIYTSGKVIKGNLVINKYYGSENNYILEDNSEFQIYDIDNELIGNYKTVDGKLEVLLPYGTYKVVQINGIEKYKLIESFDIKIEEEKDYVYDLYSEKEDKIIDDKETNKEETETSEEIKKEEDDALIVEVPDTYKFSYTNIIIGLFVIVGSVFTLLGIKKLRN